MNMSCVVCDSPIVQLATGVIDNHPVRALAFYTPGHYGTTLFDPMDGSTLELNICDSCVSKAIEKQQVMHKQIHRGPGKILKNTKELLDDDF